MATLSGIITPTNVLTDTSTNTVTNKDLISGTNTFSTSLATLTGAQTGFPWDIQWPTKP